MSWPCRCCPTAALEEVTGVLQVTAGTRRREAVVRRRCASVAMGWGEMVEVAMGRGGRRFMSKRGQACHWRQALSVGRPSRRQSIGPPTFLTTTSTPLAPFLLPAFLDHAGARGLDALYLLFVHHHRPARGASRRALEVSIVGGRDREKSLPPATHDRAITLPTVGKCFNTSTRTSLFRKRCCFETRATSSADPADMPAVVPLRKDTRTCKL